MTSLEEFTANLAASGLVPPEILARRSAPAGGSTADAALHFAKQLIFEGLITSYQARKLLDGATRGFFLGGCRLLRPLGEGGMGKVFLAETPEKVRVAVKVLPPRKVLEEANSLARFQREMELSKRVIHPNLARTLAVGVEDEIYYMILEYIPGRSLYQIVHDPQHGPLRVPDAARIFLKLLDGLEAAHNAGLVHRDIKPSNIMITPANEVKLLDMGLARVVDEKGELTRPNVVLGTLDYASPEQLRDAAQADARSDLYSVGCTLYFALSGRPPFEGGNMINKIFRQRMEDPEPIEKVARGVPTAFGAIIRTLMNKLPEERYQSCADLRRDLKRWVDPQRVRAVLGAEADAAKAFVPPELVDEDVRLFDSLADLSPATSLRDLGSPIPTPAPRRKEPPAPAPAAYRPASPRRSTSRSSSDDSLWLIRFGVIAGLTGLLIILALTLFYHF